MLNGVRRAADQAFSRLLRTAHFARRPGGYPPIGDLAVIGDRRTAAVITRAGDIVWYCPGRFDAPSLFASLLDSAIGGVWRVDLPGAQPTERRYLGESAVLETVLQHPSGRLAITDWLTLPREGTPHGLLCRSFSPAPEAMRIVLTPRPDYARRIPALRCATARRVVIDERFQLQASHPLALRGAAIAMRVAKGESAWAVLSDAATANVIASEAALRQWLAATRDGWRLLAARSQWHGPYAREVAASLRALRLLICEETGGPAAAVTTSLPEVIGGARNYDYRYSWLRDSGLALRALTRFEPEGTEAKRYLGFVAGLVGTGYRPPLDPVAAIGGERVPPQVRLPLAGYRGSRPARLGNRAARQFQLGSLASFLLAAREIYQFVEPRVHWEAVTAVADFIAAHWRQSDCGIWEQAHQRQFTTSKAFAACALEGIARFAGDPAQAERYRAAAHDIRAYIARACRTREGGYAAYAGTEAVDVSAALYPVFGFTRGADAAMDATMRALEQRYRADGALYHRHLENAGAMRREGAFLAGTFWVAHYWIARGDREHGRQIMEAGLARANDLGLFPEEIDGRTGAQLGNTPLGLVHASFLAAVADYHAAAGG